jgi:hypothetical protein
MKKTMESGIRSKLKGKARGSNLQHSVNARKK